MKKIIIHEKQDNEYLLQYIHDDSSSSWEIEEARCSWYEKRNNLEGWWVSICSLMGFCDALKRKYGEKVEVSIIET